MYHDASERRLPPSYISASLLVVYYYGKGVVPKGRHRQRKDSLPTIEIHFDAIYVFEWTRRYVSQRSIFPNKIRFEGHLMCMAVIMWSILRRQNP